MPLKKVFCVHCGRSTFVEFDAFHDATNEPTWKMKFIQSDALRHDLQIDFERLREEVKRVNGVAEEWKTGFHQAQAYRNDLQVEAGRLREEVKREKNLNRAYQENTQKLRQELNDEIARRNREEETSKGLSVQVRDLENERTVLTFCLSEKQKKLDEAREELERRGQMLKIVESNVAILTTELRDLRGMQGFKDRQQKIKDLECQLRAETEQRRGLEIKCQELRSKPQTATEVNEAQGSLQIEPDRTQRRLEGAQDQLKEARATLAVELDNNIELKKQIRSVQTKLDEARAEINRLVNEPPKSKDAETIYDLRIELSQAQRQLTKIRSIANELRKQP